MANRPLFGHGGSGLDPLARLDDQHLGGAIMLLVGGASYLAGGLWLTADLLGSEWGQRSVRVGSEECQSRVRGVSESGQRSVRPRPEVRQ
jgi:hypothetical protein